MIVVPEVPIDGLVEYHLRCDRCGFTNDYAWGHMGQCSPDWFANKIARELRAQAVTVLWWSGGWWTGGQSEDDICPTCVRKLLC